MSHPPCPRCGAAQPTACYSIIKYRRQTDHRLHALITVCSCFMWLPGWAVVTAWNAWGPEATAYVEHRCQDS